MRTPDPAGIKVTTEKNFLIYCTKYTKQTQTSEISPQERLRKLVIQIQNVYILKMPVEWLLLSVSIFQAFQDAANFSWLSATLGFTQLTSIPLCVPHTMGSLGSP